MIDDTTILRFIFEDAKKHNKLALEHVARGRTCDWFIAQDSLGNQIVGCRSLEDGRTYIDSDKNTYASDMAEFDDAIVTFLQQEELENQAHPDFYRRDASDEYGLEIGKLIERTLDELEEEVEHDCVDGHRWCEIGMPEQEKAYNDAIGCCGSHEKEVVHEESGRRFLVGIDYGH